MTAGKLLFEWPEVEEIRIKDEEWKRHAQQRRRQLPYDFGSFVFFAWWALVPIYLFSTRGWRGIIPLGWFVLLYLAAALFGNIPSLFLATRQ